MGTNKKLALLVVVLVNLGWSLALDGYYVSSQDQESGFDFSKTRPSGVVSTQFECFLYPNLSLGLIADFVYVPSARVPAFPEIALSGQSVRFGSASVGFVLGTHF